MKKAYSIFSSVLDNCYRYSVYIIFGAFSVWLWCTAMFSTSFMGEEAREHTYFVGDNLLINVLIIAAVVLFLYFIKDERVMSFLNRLEDEKLFAKLKTALLFVIFLEGILIVVSTQTYPRADQRSVLMAAESLMNGDVTPFIKSGYIERYPNQIGLMLFEYLLQFVVGDSVVMTVQILNVIALVFIYIFLGEIARSLGLGRKAELMIYIFGIVFSPLMMYCIFVYGNVIGLSLSLGGILYEIRFFEEGKIKNLVLCSLLSVLGAVIKNNYLIFFLAMLIFAVVKTIKDKKAKTSLLVVAMIFSYVVLTITPKMIVTSMVNEPLDGGTSSWSWIAMGLRDNDLRAKGWYDAFNYTTYTDSGYDGEVQSEVALAEISDRLSVFAKDFSYGVKFFIEKNASQWNNPTFQGFWLLQVASSDMEWPMWLNNLISTSNSYFWYGFLGAIQIVVLFGVVLYLLSGRKKESGYEMILITAFVGGTLFHTFWEAKCQYTLPYYVLMVPVSLLGYKAFFLAIKGTKQRKQRAISLGVPVIMLVICCVPVLNILVCPDKDTTIYATYVDSHTCDKVTVGSYHISPFDRRNVYLAVRNTGSAKSEEVYVSENMDVDTDIELLKAYNSYALRFEINKKCLDLYNNHEGAGAKVNAYPQNGSSAQLWRFKKSDDGAYYIIVGESSALAYDESSNSVTVEKLDYNENQKWFLK